MKTNFKLVSVLFAGTIYFLSALMCFTSIAATCDDPPSSLPSVKTIPAKRNINKPNIVFFMADDWSWPHAGALGDPVVKTPSFDRVCREGVLFEKAFVSTPSCTPSRLSILTGQHHWRLKEGNRLGGSLREEFPVYTELLQDSGYRIGRFGKGVWPSKHTFRKRDSFGERYKSFEQFIKERKPGQPFCYWHGGQDPHRPYELNVGAKSGIPLSKISVPKCLPDNETVRNDLADYLWEVQRFDHEVGQVIQQLETMGELENTIIVVSGDNGMPFPRCKATLYDQGTRVPLAIRWGANVTGGRTVSDFVSLCDLAPTFLAAAGLQPPAQMTGRSLMPILESKKSGQVEEARTFVLTGNEKHVYLYPSRAIRTKNFLYIRNFAPDRWRTGVVKGKNPEYDFAVEPWPTEKGAFSFNIDPSPTKQFLRLHGNDLEVAPYADLAFFKRPDEELYALQSDPGQLKNLARNRQYAKAIQRLRQHLDAELIRADDPRSSLDGYQTRVVQGWPVRINDELLASQKQKTEKAIELIDGQLNTLSKILPPEVLRSLRNVTIWLSPQYPGVRPTGEYHPNAAWLKKVGRRPELFRCVEFTNISIFERECRRMPMLLLHELAHAYHHQVLEFDNPQIIAAYRRADESGTYNAILRSNGRTEKAYGMNDHKEYFAETSEALFGTNDFYPFDEPQLKKHDPEMHKLLRELWRLDVDPDTIIYKN